jgi:hypothetical protein
LPPSASPSLPSAPPEERPKAKRESRHQALSRLSFRLFFTFPE